MNSGDAPLQVRSPLHDIAASAHKAPPPAKDGTPVQSESSRSRPSRSGRPRSLSRGRANSEGRSLAGAPASRLSTGSRVSNVALPICVYIPRIETDKGMLGQQTTYYIVEASGFGSTSRSRHQFDEFEVLHSSISAKISYALPPMPTKSWFGNNNEDVIEERRGKLENVLGKMLMLQGAVDDNEELLWRFLNLPRPVVVAARFLACQPESRGRWLLKLWETSAEAKGGNVPLQHPAVERQLVDVAERAYDENGKLTEKALAHLNDISIACELLARIFSSAHGVRPTDFGKEPERHEWIPVLLTLARVELPDPANMANTACKDGEPSPKGTPQSLPVQEAASKALRMLAQGGQWKAILCAFLFSGGTADLLATAQADSTSNGNSGDPKRLERLVAELLLRGFEGPVPKAFASPEATKDRKQLLNTLFVSSDVFVRITVGLILSGLLCEESFAEVGQAEMGLQSLCEELLPAKLAQVDIWLLLHEDSIWKWLCRLVEAPRSIVSGFALLVVTHVAQPNPDLVFETEGFHDTLITLTVPEADPQCRDLASKILLSALRGGSRPLPARDVVMNICDALAINADAVLQSNVQEHKVQGAAVAQAEEWSVSVCAVEELFTAARESVDSFKSEAEEWKNAVTEAVKAASETKEKQLRLGDALGEQDQSLTDNTAKLAEQKASHEEEDATANLQARQEQLETQEHELRMMEERVNRLAEERMAYTKSLAEQDEAVRKLRNEIEQVEPQEREAIACGDVPTELAEYLRGRRTQLQEVLERIDVMRAEAAVLDEQLQESTEGLPEWRKALSGERQSVEELVARSDSGSPTSGLDSWATWLDRQRVCQDELLRVQQSIENAGTCIKSESRQRHQLRSTIAQLTESLASLDGFLASLESWDERFEDTY
mmetsp:Transcript_156226/g.299441  ORF Transcript_156226/g.299441 Transcript_156226/m.299441 type:complete len:896 (-) Transcript_156226:37-2724(-)